MIFNEHSELEGRHAQFSPSKSSWLRYSNDKIISTYVNRHRTELGTEIHEFINSQIEMSQKATSVRQISHDISTYIYSKYREREMIDYGKALINSLNNIPEEVFETAKMFINDAIGFRMRSEVILKYSDNFFGTTDAISFKNNVLKINDFKSGDLEAHMDQLIVYAALFCLEYKIKPSEITIQLRLYQYAKYNEYIASIDDIVPVMDKIVTSDNLLKKQIEYEENSL